MNIFKNYYRELFENMNFMNNERFVYEKGGPSTATKGSDATPEVKAQLKVATDKQPPKAKKPLAEDYFKGHADKFDKHIKDLHTALSLTEKKLTPDEQKVLDKHKAAFKTVDTKHKDEYKEKVTKLKGNKNVALKHIKEKHSPAVDNLVKKVKEDIDKTGIKPNQIKATQKKAAEAAETTKKPAITAENLLSLEDNDLIAIDDAISHFVLNDYEGFIKSFGLNEAKTKELGGLKDNIQNFVKTLKTIRPLLKKGDYTEYFKKSAKAWEKFKPTADKFHKIVGKVTDFRKVIDATHEHYTNAKNVPQDKKNKFKNSLKKLDENAEKNKHKGELIHKHLTDDPLIGKNAIGKRFGADVATAIDNMFDGEDDPLRKYLVMRHDISLKNGKLAIDGNEITHLDDATVKNSKGENVKVRKENTLIHYLPDDAKGNFKKLLNSKTNLKGKTPEEQKTARDKLIKSLNETGAKEVEGMQIMGKLQSEMLNHINKNVKEGEPGAMDALMMILQLIAAIQKAFKDGDWDTLKDFLSDWNESNDPKEVSERFKASQAAYKERMGKNPKPTMKQALKAHVKPREKEADAIFLKDAPKDKTKALSKYRNEIQDPIKEYIASSLGSNVTIDSIDEEKGKIIKIVGNKGDTKIEMMITLKDGNNFEATVNKLVKGADDKEVKQPLHPGKTGPQSMADMKALATFLAGGTVGKIDKPEDQNADKTKPPETKSTNRYTTKDLKGKNWKQLKSIIIGANNGKDVDKKLIRENYKGRNKNEKQENLNKARIKWILDNKVPKGKATKEQVRVKRKPKTKADILKTLKSPEAKHAFEQAYKIKGEVKKAMIEKHKRLRKTLGKGERLWKAIHEEMLKVKGYPKLG